jgi:4-hydroxy-3-methylbut-2-en-1-yl diphosphate reductase
LQVTIDSRSGFCFGVVYAIGVAERELHANSELYCLGDIVHNDMEVKRLSRMGLKTISHKELEELHDCKVLIRAHGEPPETYNIAFRNNIELIDASCPIVLHLQNVIRDGYLEMKQKNGQVVIYGKAGHAEVNGLNGQTGGEAIIAGDEKDLAVIDYSRPVRLYSQTTMSVEGFRNIAEIIRAGMEAAAKDKPVDFEWNDSICRQVSNRKGHLQDFATRFDVVIFVTGVKSSNGMILHKVVQEANSRTHLVSDAAGIKKEWFVNAGSVGICGATSTPVWLMEDIGKFIRETIH